LVQAFLKKWWVESDFKAPNLPFRYGSKFLAVTMTVFHKSSRAFNSSLTLSIELSHTQIVNTIQLFGHIFDIHFPEFGAVMTTV
jgi:hypothetical protein